MLMFPLHCIGILSNILALPLLLHDLLHPLLQSSCYFLKALIARMWFKSFGTSRILPPTMYSSIYISMLPHLFFQGTWALMATSSLMPLSHFTAVALEHESSFPFFLGKVLAKCPNLPHMKHQTLDRSFFFFPCCSYHLVARAASSSSYFFILNPPLLNSLLIIVRISSYRRISHMSPQFGSCTLPKLIWTKVSQ